MKSQLALVGCAPLIMMICSSAQQELNTIVVRSGKVLTASVPLILRDHLVSANSKIDR